MEQKTKSTAAAQRASKIKALRTEASDVVRHSWLALTGMNILSVLIPILIPAAYVVLAVLMKLPAGVETVAGGVVALLAGMAWQAYFTMGQGSALLKAADNKEIGLRDAVSRADDAGRGLSLFLLGLIVLCASLVPGAAVVYGGLCLSGLWRIVVAALGCVLALALLLVVLLSGCLSLFVMAEDADCGAAVALLRSARMMKGHKRELIQSLLMPLLIFAIMTAAMALLLWPLLVKRDLLTDTLMFAGAVAYVIDICWTFMHMQASLACLYDSIRKE